MKVKGVCYDVGRVMMDGNWRPRFDQKIVQRELEIIKNDLHANAVRICGLDIKRLVSASEIALSLGLEVWISPEMWDRSQADTLQYLVEAAKQAENLRMKWGEHTVFSLGSELTLFMQGIIDGNNIFERMNSPSFLETIKSGRHNSILNNFLDSAASQVRGHFHGPLTYFSVPFEKVHWQNFDFVGVDLYRDARIREIFGDLTRSYLSYGKPLIIGETGCCTYQGAEKLGGSGFVISFEMMEDYLNEKTEPPQGMSDMLKLAAKKDGHYVRDEDLQAREVVDQLDIFNSEGATGAFVFTFVSPNSPFNSNPRYDLDMASYSLVKSYPEKDTLDELVNQATKQGREPGNAELTREAITGLLGEIGKHGMTYPDLPWEPKESFRSVSKFFLDH